MIFLALSLLLCTFLASCAVPSLNSTNSTVDFGNFYNFWDFDPETFTFDLTRGNSTNHKTIKAGTNKINVQPHNSAFVVVDMQNFFLHPAFASHTTGLAAVDPIINTVKAFRAAGSKVIWCQWGLSEFDLRTIGPAFKFSFAANTGVNGTPNPDASFGSEMGVFGGIDFGRKLIAGQFNAQPYGPLFDLANDGIANGTDLYFSKNRLSCLWGAQTPMGLYTEANEISTLFFSGVNADQCVFGSFIDAFYKGYDAIIVQDATATTSPSYAMDMVLFNAAIDGFVTNSSDIIAGITGTIVN